MTKLALIHKYTESFDASVFPDEYYDIPDVQNYQDIGAVQDFAYSRLRPYAGQNVDLYINGGIAIELLCVLRAASALGIHMTVLHRNSQTGIYHPQSVTWTSSDPDLLPDGPIFTLCEGRHITVAQQAVFPKIMPEQIFNFAWQEEYARRALSPYSGTDIRIYLTGLKPLCISTLNAACQLGIHITWLHYDCDTEEYFSQRM